MKCSAVLGSVRPTSWVPGAGQVLQSFTTHRVATPGSGTLNTVSVRDLIKQLWYAILDGGRIHICGWLTVHLTPILRRAP